MIHHDRARRLLVEAVQKTFEELAFIDTEEYIGPDEVQPRRSIRAAITAPFRGELVLELPADVEEKMITNIFGDSAHELPASRVRDCLVEAGNIITGTMLAGLFPGENQKYQVAESPAPYGASAPADQGAAGLTIIFSAEGPCFRIHLKW